MALAAPAGLPAATSFASVSPVETQNTATMSETITSVGQDNSLADTEKLCLDDNFGRSRLKKLLQSQRKVILTFDDGPHPHSTPYILDILKQRNLKAVFFILGLQANKFPNLVKRIHEEGHIIGNHTYGHKNLATMSPEAIEKEIEKTSNLLEKITGERPKYLRPPYGATNKKVIEVVNKAGMKIVLWTVDTRDWRSKSEKAILNEIDRQLSISKGKLKGGAILMHDIYPATVKALGPVLDKLAANDYKIAAINKLGSTEEEFWAVKSPVMSKGSICTRHADPEISHNPFLISLIKGKKKAKPSHYAMLKAKKEGHLLLYLAKTEIK